MFDTKEQIKVACNRIWEFVRKLGRGETLTYEVMAATGGIEFTDPSFKTVARKVIRRLLKDRSIAVRAEPKIGYRLLTNSEQVTRCAQDRSRRAYRQIKRGRREVSAVDNSDLSDHLIRVKVASEQSMAEQRRSLFRSLKAMSGNGLVGKPESRPRTVR